VATGKTPLELIAATVQVVSVAIGVVISVLSFNTAREREADAQRVAAAKPFLELRQTVYTDAVKQAGILSNPEVFTEEEVAMAKKRFRALYVAELSMVEAPEVAQAMIDLAELIDPPLRTFTPAQKAAYELSQALGESYASTWGVPVAAKQEHQ